MSQINSIDTTPKKRKPRRKPQPIVVEVKEPSMTLSMIKSYIIPVVLCLLTSAATGGTVYGAINSSLTSVKEDLHRLSTEMMPKEQIQDNINSVNHRLDLDDQAIRDIRRDQERLLVPATVSTKR